jgi:hypothetical protein
MGWGSIIVALPDSSGREFVVFGNTDAGLFVGRPGSKEKNGHIADNGFC